MISKWKIYIGILVVKIKRSLSRFWSWFKKRKEHQFIVIWQINLLVDSVVFFAALMGGTFSLVALIYGLMSVVIVMAYSEVSRLKDKLEGVNG